MFWNKKKHENRSTTGLTLDELMNIDWNTATGAQLVDIELKEKTYYLCVKTNSESIAKMPCLLKQKTENGSREATEHYLYDIIKNRPNPYMSSVDFWKCVEANRQHRGDSAIFLSRDFRGKITGCYPIKINRMVVDDVGLIKTTKQNPILVYYTDLNCQSGKEYTCLYSDIAHFKGMTMDGLFSLSIKNNLKGLLDINKLTQEYQQDVFANGGMNKIALQMMVSDIKNKKDIAKIQSEFDALFKAKSRVWTIPVGYQATPVNVSLADNQFKELKLLNATDIASVFGVPKYFLGDMEGYNNNSIEQASLNYLVNTLHILMESIESELNYKLLTPKERQQGYYFSFDESVLLRVDAKTQAEINCSYVQNSILSPNEVRVSIGKEKAIDGDDLLASSGTLKIKDLYKTAKDNTSGGGDNNGQQQ